MLLALALLGLTLPIFLSCWLMAGSLRAALVGWAEIVLPTAAVMTAFAGLGALASWLEFTRLL